MSSLSNPKVAAGPLSHVEAGSRPKPLGSAAQNIYTRLPQRSAPRPAE